MLHPSEINQTEEHRSRWQSLAERLIRLFAPQPVAALSSKEESHSKQEPHSAEADAAALHHARRGLLLAKLLLLCLPLDLALLPGCLLPHTNYPFLFALLIGITLHLLSILPNRRGNVLLAGTIFLSSPVIACTLGLFTAPAHDWLDSRIIYLLLAIPVVESGALVGRRAPLWVAGISNALIALHVQHTIPAHQYAIAIAPIVTLQVLAFLTLLTTTSLEEALDQTEQMRRQQKLHQELQAAHEALQSTHEQMNQQAKELSAMNQELIAMQSELETSYRQLEIANRHLEQQATTDPMTGLANHRMFQQSLRTLVAQVQRHEQPLALMMLDVDHFKGYNDTYGHPAGDEVLRIIGSLLRKSVRTGDIPTRYGGEEFAILLPHTELDAAREVAERVRLAVEKYTFPNRAVTVSIGLASLYLHANDAASLVQAADEALYQAKAQGRNCIASSLLHASYTEAMKSAPRESLAGEDDPTVHDQDCLLVIPPMAHDNFGGVEGLIQDSPDKILGALLAALDVRDAEVFGHSLRVARYSLRLAQALSEVYDEARLERTLIPWITPSDMRDLALGALLHDIGKIGVPDHILRKTGTLTEQEWAIMRRHPIVGAKLVYEFGMLAPALPVVRHHHERWDGLGYPDGLKGEDIPLAARIFAVADTFEAMTTDRPYRHALSYQETRTEILHHSETQFDPQVVQAFLLVPQADWEVLREGSLEAESQRAA